MNDLYAAQAALRRALERAQPPLSAIIADAMERVARALAYERDSGPAGDVKSNAHKAASGRMLADYDKAREMIDQAIEQDWGEREED